MDPDIQSFKGVLEQAGLPESPPPQHPTPTEHLPYEVESLGIPTETIPLEAVALPITSEEITARWGQLRGGWQRFRGMVSGAVGRARAASQNEVYDPARHNRTVQNQLYKHVAELPVRNFLAANDHRYARYAVGTVGAAERTRELTAEALGAPLYLVAAVGLTAWRGFANRTLQNAAPDSPLALVAREGARSRAYHQEVTWHKRNQCAADALLTPVTARQRAAAVQHHINQVPPPTPDELARIVEEVAKLHRPAA